MSRYTRLRTKVPYRVQLNANLIYEYSGVDVSDVPEISESDLAILGVSRANAASSITLPVVRACTPRPYRVSKSFRVAGRKRSFSTFCAYDKLRDAEANGWRIVQVPATRGLQNIEGTASISVYVEVGGVNYGFSMSREDFETFGATLGIKTADSLTGASDINRLIFGASYPKPGKATKKLDDGSTFTSFYDPSKYDDLKEWRRTLAKAAA